MLRNLTKIILELITLFLLICFQFKMNSNILMYLILILFLITNYMYKYRDRIYKFKFTYNTLLVLFSIFSILTFIFIIFIPFKNMEYSNVDISIIGNLIVLYFVIKITIDSIVDIKKNINKVNNYLIIITTIVISLVLVRYYFDISLLLNDDLKGLEYINQNYVYFIFMLIIIEIHKYISKKMQKSD